MSVLQEAFDVLVVGNEPAAYWWIDKAIQYTKAFPQDGKKSFSIPRILHLSLRNDIEVALPTTIAERFGISVSSKEEVECIFPDRLIEWSNDTLKERFGFKSNKEKHKPFAAVPKSSDLTTIRFHLKQHPELLDIAQGIWRIFGRSEKLLPELLLWNALQLTSYSFWKPELPKEHSLKISSVSELPENNWLRQNSQGLFEIEYLSGATLVAPQLILAVNGNELAGIRAKCPDLAPHLPTTQDLLSENALYNLNLFDVEEKFLTHLQPYSVYFEHESLPMPEELFHLRSRSEKKNLSVHFLHKFDFSLDTITEVATRAYNQVIKILPDLPHTPHTIELPLDLKDLLKDEPRDAAIHAFQLHRQPLYKASFLHSRTLHSRIHLFTPFLNCHLAYPYGQLEAAKTFLSEYFGRKRFRKSSHLVEPAAFFG